MLYDLSSSYVEGRCCELAALGHNRDGKPGKLQVNWGLVCSPEGRPVAVQVHPGNTADPSTVHRERECHKVCVRQERMEPHAFNTTEDPIPASLL